MYWIIRILIVAALIVAVLFGVGLLMPAERPVTKTTLIDALPDRVFAVVTDIDNFTQWRSGLERVTLESASGPLRVWNEIRRGGVVVRVQEVVREPDRRYVFEYTSNTGIRGRWEGEFERSNENRTKLTCTETVIIDQPLFRLPAYVMLNTGADLDLYLGELDRRLATMSDDTPADPSPSPRAAATDR